MTTDYDFTDRGLNPPIGFDEKGRVVRVNLEKDGHLLINGWAGSGKTATLNSLLYGCLHRGWQAVVAGPEIDRRLDAEYAWVEPRLLRYTRDHESTRSLLEWAASELRDRLATMAEWGVPHYDKLPHSVRPKPLLVVVDGLGSLTHRDADPSQDEPDDPEIVDIVKSIVRTGRAAGVHLAASDQRPIRTRMLKNDSAHLLIGPREPYESLIALREPEATNDVTLGYGEGFWEPSDEPLTQVILWWAKPQEFAQHLYEGSQA